MATVTVIGWGTGCTPDVAATLRLARMAPAGRHLDSPWAIL